jgi:hypothetical protein
VGGGENRGAGEREDAGLGVGRVAAREEGGKRSGGRKLGGRGREVREWGVTPPPFLTWYAHARHHLVTCGNVPR